MFRYCSSLQHLDLTVFKSTRCEKMNTMFANCSSLANSNVSWVWVSGMSSSNVRKVVDAFNSWAWV